MLKPLPDIFRQFDADQIGSLTEGFTGADMKRMVSDLKALYAGDVVRERLPSTAGAYLEEAAFRDSRQQIADDCCTGGQANVVARPRVNADRLA